MEARDIQHVAVLGAGSMGHGITQVIAMAGYDVTMHDIKRDRVEEGYKNIEWSLEKLTEKGRLEKTVETVLDRVETAVDLERAVEDADLVIEAAPENMELKKEIFGALDASAPEHAVLASNTSSLSITEMAAATSHPERVVGMHFFNPPVKMDLVEVVYGDETTDETSACTATFVEDIGKTPIYVRKDVRGFVVNTVLLPFLVESAWIVSAGEASIEEADAAMVHERGYPMGPFELADLTGIDVNYHVLSEAGNPIPPALAERFETGNYGRKTGEGFYDYEDGEGVTYGTYGAEVFDTLRVEARMINEGARLVGDGVATPEAIDTGMKLGTAFPEGPCRRADEIGLDSVQRKLRRLYEATGEKRYEPAEYLAERVVAGETGVDAGVGFYTYGDGDR
jgi:enoyl-CoA hydratase/3-hydroxyacyl-CoA dehydrogenase